MADDLSTTTTTSKIANDAELIYEYHRMHMPLPEAGADAIFTLCSLDLRVAQRAAQLYLDGYGRYLIFSGGIGKLTANQPAFRNDPEAVVFARIATEMGVPEDKIIVESKSTNTGENVRFTYNLLKERGLIPDQDHVTGADSDNREGIWSFILVQKPYMERRTYATFMKQWPGFGSGGELNRFHFIITSPQFHFADYPDDDNPRDLIINIMVGDLVRIQDYPAKGFQIPQDIPDNVWEAAQRLIAAGFNKHLS